MLFFEYLNLLKENIRLVIKVIALFFQLLDLVIIGIP
jgi:hypothetical protein